MKYIYLDTNHLKNIRPADGYKAIYDKLNNRDLTLVLSVINMLELLRREDRERVGEVSKKLDRFLVKYLMPPCCLFKKDIFKYTSNANDIDFFSDDKRMLIPEIDDLDLFMDLKSDQDHREFFNLLYNHTDREKIVSEELVKIYNDQNRCLFVDGQVKENAIFESADTKFTVLAGRCDISKELLEKSNCEAKYSPSFLIPFVVQLMKSQNKKEKLNSGDMLDASHCAAIPYVDYFLTDRGNCDDAKNALKKIKSRYEDFYDGDEFSEIASKPADLDF